MAYTTINKSTDYFNTKLYTGMELIPKYNRCRFSTRFYFGLKIDLVVLDNHRLLMLLEVQIKFSTSTNGAENAEEYYTYYQVWIVMVGQVEMVQVKTICNRWYLNGYTHVAWNWKAGGGQGSSNTDGSINTTYTSANTTAGFSICSYTGTGSNATVGHGLGVAPKVVIIKDRDNAISWVVGSTMLWVGIIIIYLNVLLHNKQQTFSMILHLQIH